MYTNTSAPRSATPACFAGLPAATHFSLLPCPVPAQRGKSATPGGSKKKAKGATGPLAGLQGAIAGSASPMPVANIREVAAASAHQAASSCRPCMAAAAGCAVVMLWCRSTLIVS